MRVVAEQLRPFERCPTAQLDADGPDSLDERFPEGDRAVSRAFVGSVRLVRNHVLLRKRGSISKDARSVFVRRLIASNHDPDLVVVFQPKCARAVADEVRVALK